MKTRILAAFAALVLVCVGIWGFSVAPAVGGDPPLGRSSILHMHFSDCNTSELLRFAEVTATQERDKVVIEEYEGLTDTEGWIHLEINNVVSGDIVRVTITPATVGGPDSGHGFVYVPYGLEGEWDIIEEASGREICLDEEEDGQFYCLYMDLSE